MQELIYSRERTLGNITLLLGLLVWLALIAGTFGGALIGLAIGFILYLFIQSGLIAHLKGNGVELSETQFPDLYKQFTDCCEQLKIKKIPQAYILNGNGGLNAFATKFLGTEYVVLMSDVVDAMEKHTDGVRFYLGHELGHLRMKHLTGQLLRWPVLWLPLLGAAYSRARESTCDRHGAACCGSPDGAARALAALSAGVERWKSLDVETYLGQVQKSSGFWMSFHELIAGYPWLTKRVSRVVDDGASIPKRNFLSYLLAFFVPYAGRLGGAFGFLIMIYIIGILAAVAIPAYQDFTVKPKLAVAVSESEHVREALGRYYELNQVIPDSLDVIGINENLTDEVQLTFDAEEMLLIVQVDQGKLIFRPALNEQGHVIWGCENGAGIKVTQLPASCRRIEGE